MPPTLGAHARLENDPRAELRVPPGAYLRSASGRISASGSSATLAIVVIDPTRTGRLLDAVIAAGAFVLTVALLAAGAGEVDLVGVLLAALASLPLVARRAAPLAVFVLTALASAVLYGVTEITGPPVGPTVALYGLASGGDGSRARTLLTLGLVALMLAIHVTATGLDEGRFPGPSSCLACCSGAAPGSPATARGCGASGWPSSRSAPCARSGMPSASAGWRRRRNARASPAIFTTPPVTRST